MLMATTCDELKPFALSAVAASGVAPMDFRSDCKSSLVCATTSSTFARTAGCNCLMSTTCMLRMTVLDSGGGSCALGCGDGASRGGNLLIQVGKALRVLTSRSNVGLERRLPREG